MKKERKFRFYLSYGHDVDEVTPIEVKAKNREQAYFRAVNYYKSIFDTLNKKLTLKEIFKRKGIEEYLPYFYEVKP